MRPPLVWILFVCLTELCRDARSSDTNESSLGSFSGDFELAGVRSFVQDQDVKTRIIGGQETWAHSWPWQVSLRFTTMPACGGAVIAPLWVISAAHCFKRYNKASFWTVLAGKHDLDNSLEEGQQVVGVSAIVSHHRYNAHTKEYDVALLKLKSPLTFNRFVRPINVWMAPLPTLEKCTITGWGATRENGARVTRLQEVNVTVLPSDVCNRYYKSRIRASMFCAGKEAGGVDSCQGDSGGPLSCFTGNNYKLAAVVSWGIGCGRARKPGVYTRIKEHAHWMSNVIENQDVAYADQLTQENRCGKQQQPSCQNLAGPVGLSVSEDGELLVENVTESCSGSWPWMVSLQANGIHYCSGVLIHRRWVLAAHHCRVRAREDVALLGVHDLRLSLSQSVPVDEVFNLPQEDSFPPKADLSLLRLAAPARLGTSVFPVCVPDEDEELDDDWSCVSAGWGATSATVAVNPERLHHARLALVNQTACSDKWGRGLVSDTLLCTHPAGASACTGDSGAPLFCRKHGDYFLFGVLTWGSRQCDPNKPAIFSKVSDYYSWISELTEDV
ncbi:ovochymase-1 isoform X1 [Nerophis lumbriciformis]|uniref:ovochymase-1 isoform X1 n=1 Tax=Nerophis lumbriciformis TaxID=546530 RepID=UPI002AE0721D|nr:transmembrane protease serine 9-like isoform X1 [Nerophis lumbriciformis]